jgi:hypothetical protein
MFSYFKKSPLKVVISRTNQIDIVREIERKFKNLIEMASNEHQPSREFKLHAKTVLQTIKFSLEKYVFDGDIEDAMLEIGDYIVSYVSGYIKKYPATALKDIMKIKPCVQEFL